MKNIMITSFLSLNVVWFSLLSFAVYAQAEENPELRRSSIVVVAQPEFKFHAQQVFFWASNYADVSGELKKSAFSVQQLIDTAIKDALKAKGFAFKDKAKNSLLVQYHVSLESEMDDTALAINYGLAPGLRANSAATKKHERGTLVVDFIDPALNKVVWRGAIGVFTGIEDTDQGRQQRVNKLLIELFNGLPTAK